MGDSYRPGGDGRGRYQGGAYDRPQDRNYRPQQYDPYPPPMRYRDSRPQPPPPGTSSYHPSGPPPSSYRDNESRGGEFTFRGAAGGQSYRPQENFTFNAPGPRAPNGFAPEGPRAARDRPRRFDRDGRPPRHDSRPRGSSGPSRGRGNFRGFGPRAAHSRDILSKMASTRETTPEQMEGMDEGPSRFKDVPDFDDEPESDDDAPRKRAKVEPTEAPAAPKWSNPDPYTALPPPESLGAPKKDIVQAIRKAKNEQATKAEGSDKVANNSDFISLNFDDDGDKESVMDSPPAKSPSSSSSAPTFSHRDVFHRKTSNATTAANGASPSSFTPTNPHQKTQPPIPGSTDYGGPPPRPLGEMQPINPDSAIVPERVSRPPKRKARDTRMLGDVVEEWQSVNGHPTAPWCTTDHSDTQNVGLRLHKEICDFFDYVKPRPFEEAARRDLVSRVQQLIRNWEGGGGHGKEAEVHCFGSFASGLYLPTADMDLVVLSKSFMSGGQRQIGQSMNQLRTLTNYIERMGICKPHTATFIGKSKVPLVKFTDKRTGIKVDISFENDSGFPALKTFEAWKQDYPALPVIVSLVKQLLVMRGINEVFSGGIGGYTTICLVVHILQTMPELQSGAMDATQHYGEVFMKFLDFYGNKLDIRSSGILMHPPFHYDKDKHPKVSQNPNRLTIIDPNNPDNDISGGSHKIDTVFGRFRTSYSELQRHMAQIHANKISTLSILECIIGGNYESVDTQRERLRNVFGALGPSNTPALAPAPALPPGVKDTKAPRLGASKAQKRAMREQDRQKPTQGQRGANPTKYVQTMANVPSGGGNYYANGTPPSPLHYPSNTAYPFSYYPYSTYPVPAGQYPSTHDYDQHPISESQSLQSPYWWIPPPPPPSSPPPPPPPPLPERDNAPFSPASSASMEMSD